MSAVFVDASYFIALFRPRDRTGKGRDGTVNDWVIEVDELAVDSTYGSPKSVRQYDQGIAESYFVEIVRE